MTDLIYVPVKKEVRGCTGNWNPVVCLTVHHFADQHCRLYINVNKKCLKIFFFLSSPRGNSAVSKFEYQLNFYIAIRSNFSEFPSHWRLHTRLDGQKLSSSNGDDVIKYYLLRLCDNMILKLQENPIISHIEGKVQTVKHIETSTAIPSQVGAIRMTLHPAYRQLAQLTPRTAVENTSTDILPLNMGDYMSNTGTGFLVKSSYVQKRGSQSPQWIKSLKLVTSAAKPLELFHIVERESKWGFYFTELQCNVGWQLFTDVSGQTVCSISKGQAVQTCKCLHMCFIAYISKTNSLRCSLCKGLKTFNKWPKLVALNIKCN